MASKLPPFDPASVNRDPLIADILAIFEDGGVWFDLPTAFNSGGADAARLTLEALSSRSLCHPMAVIAALGVHQFDPARKQIAAVISGYRAMYRRTGDLFGLPAEAPPIEGPDEAQEPTFRAVTFLTRRGVHRVPLAF